MWLWLTLSIILGIPTILSINLILKVNKAKKQQLLGLPKEQMYDYRKLAFASIQTNIEKSVNNTLPVFNVSQFDTICMICNSSAALREYHLKQKFCNNASCTNNDAKFKFHVHNYCRFCKGAYITKMARYHQQEKFLKC